MESNKLQAISLMEIAVTVTEYHRHLSTGKISQFNELLTL